VLFSAGFSLVHRTFNLDDDGGAKHSGGDSKKKTPQRQESLRSLLVGTPLVANGKCKETLPPRTTTMAEVGVGVVAAAEMSDEEACQQVQRQMGDDGEEKEGGFVFVSEEGEKEEELGSELGFEPGTRVPLDEKEPLLHLAEPDPFKELDEWSQWFDNLKACLEATKARAALLGKAAASRKAVPAPPPQWANQRQGPY